MWLSKRRELPRGRTALVGEATVEGNPAGVLLETERRNLPVYGPGGYQWRPTLGQEVLVIKGDAGELPCVAAARCDGMLAAGEVRIAAGTGAGGIYLKNDGTVALTGKITVNGIPIEQLGGGGSGTVT